MTKTTRRADLKIWRGSAALGCIDLTARQIAYFANVKRATSRKGLC